MPHGPTGVSARLGGLSCSWGFSPGNVAATFFSAHFPYKAQRLILNLSHLHKQNLAAPDHKDARFLQSLQTQHLQGVPLSWHVYFGILFQDLLLTRPALIRRRHWRNTEYPGGVRRGWQPVLMCENMPEIHTVCRHQCFSEFTTCQRSAPWVDTSVSLSLQHNRICSYPNEYSVISTHSNNNTGCLT